jgi:hypothetical protein
VEIFAYFLIFLTGVSFGLVGAGGAIIVVPILVYLMNQTPKNATGYSTFISVLVSGTGAALALREKSLDIKRAIAFAVPTAVVAFCIRFWLVPALPQTILGLPQKSAFMLGFALILPAAGYAMIANRQFKSDHENPYLAVLFGLGIGVISGLFGVGGGFLIVPVMALAMQMDMKVAIPTSLGSVFIITLSSFIAEASRHPDMPWKFLLGISIVAALGMVAGSLARRRIDGARLKKGFGYFVVVIAVIIVIQEIIKLNQPVAKGPLVLQNFYSKHIWARS